MSQFALPGDAAGSCFLASQWSKMENGRENSDSPRILALHCQVERATPDCRPNQTAAPVPLPPNPVSLQATSHLSRLAAQARYNGFSEHDTKQPQITCSARAEKRWWRIDTPQPTASAVHLVTPSHLAFKMKREVGDGSTGKTDT